MWLLLLLNGAAAAAVSFHTPHSTFSTVLCIMFTNVTQTLHVCANVCVVFFLLSNILDFFLRLFFFLHLKLEKLPKCEHLHAHPYDFIKCAKKIFFFIIELILIKKRLSLYRQKKNMMKSKNRRNLSWYVFHVKFAWLESLCERDANGFILRIHTTTTTKKISIMV